MCEKCEYAMCECVRGLVCEVVSCVKCMMCEV
jgi:hypothetical protein